MTSKLPASPPVSKSAKRRARRRKQAERVTANVAETGELTAARQTFHALSTIGGRAAISAALGKSYGGDRDIYESLGFKKDLEFDDLMGRYKRQDIARAVVDAPVRACWRKRPIIGESGVEDSPLSIEWNALAKRLKLYHYFGRLDRLASIGEYAVLLLGLADGKEWVEPCERAKDVLYMMPYSQNDALVDKYVEDKEDPRYGLPDIYEITMAKPDGSAGDAVKVHASRVIHVAEDKLLGENKGTARLEAVYNLLQCLELVIGGSSEMFWRGGFPGYGFSTTDGGHLGDTTDLEEEIDTFIHGLRRYFKLENMKVDTLSQQVADPSNIVDVLVTLISAATRIPKRILTGSERGELASGQDEHNWISRIEERQQDHCEPSIVQETVDRFMAVGVLPAVENYTVEWPDLHTQSDEDRAKVAKTTAEAVKAWVESGAESYMPWRFYAKTYLDLSPEQIDEMEAEAEEERAGSAADQATLEGDGEFVDDDGDDADV